jgi:hypothetical protein
MESILQDIGENADLIMFSSPPSNVKKLFVCLPVVTHRNNFSSYEAFRWASILSPIGETSCRPAL